MNIPLRCLNLNDMMMSSFSSGGLKTSLHQSFSYSMNASHSQWLIVIVVYQPTYHQRSGVQSLNENTFT